MALKNAKHQKPGWEPAPPDPGTIKDGIRDRALRAMQRHRPATYDDSERHEEEKSHV
jgi:hypothetical protein